MAALVKFWALALAVMALLAFMVDSGLTASILCLVSLWMLWGNARAEKVERPERRRNGAGRRAEDRAGLTPAVDRRHSVGGRLVDDTPLKL